MHSPHFKWHEESRIYDFVQYRELPMSAMTPVLVSFPVAVLKYPDKKHLGGEYVNLGSQSEVTQAITV